MSGVLISASRARIQLRLPCTRVDLAVVREVAVRVRERPRRERVGGEAAVHQRERRLDPLVGEVGEELGELRRGEHALVDERAARQRREVDRRRRRAVDAGDLVLAALAHHEQLAVELDAGGAGRVVDEQLAEARHHARARSARSSSRRRAPRASRDPQALVARRSPRSRAIGLLGRRRRRAGRNARPDAVGARPAAAAKSTTARRKRSGTWRRIPAPSPVLTSAPDAPRWSRLQSAPRASVDDRRGWRGP